jgi:hypothetical protein
VKITVLTQPEPLVDVEEAKLALGFQGTSDRDEMIEGLILAAQAELDGPTGWVGISVAEHQVELRLDMFTSTINLPYGPVVGVGSVDYLDDEGAEQTAGAELYDVLTDSIVLIDGESWPESYGQAEAVRITYDVGISDENDPRVSLMKAAIIMHVKMTMDMEDVEARRKAIKAITAPLRVWG